MAFKGAGNVCVTRSCVSTVECGALGSSQPGLLQLRGGCFELGRGQGAQDAAGNWFQVRRSTRCCEVYHAEDLGLFILLAYCDFHFNCTVTSLFCLCMDMDNSDCTGPQRQQTICTQVTGVSQSASFVLGFGLRIFSPLTN